MKITSTLALGLASVVLAAPATKEDAPVPMHWTRTVPGQESSDKLDKRYIKGMDISSYQNANYDFSSAYKAGARFVLIKATEGTSYKSPAFSSQYDGATKAGFIRGGYHFARPDVSGGAAQAGFFYKNGGGWSKDGITLPGMLDIEYGPQSTCYGLSQSAMVSWIKDFVNEYHAKSSRYPIIYSTNDWWDQCTGNTKSFSSTCPLDLASYNDSPGTIPGGWEFETFWQYNNHFAQGGDSDYWNGDSAGLKKMATG